MKIKKGDNVVIVTGDDKGPGSTHTPIALVHATVSPGASLSLPWRWFSGCCRRS